MSYNLEFLSFLCQDSVGVGWSLQILVLLGQIHREQPRQPRVENLSYTTTTDRLPRQAPSAGKTLEGKLGPAVFRQKELRATC